MTDYEERTVRFAGPSHVREIHELELEVPAVGDLAHSRPDRPRESTVSAGQVQVPGRVPRRLHAQGPEAASAPREVARPTAPASAGRTTRARDTSGSPDRRTAPPTGRCGA